ncbi:hypothetical protein C0Q70_03029 [Pomacea canaliculata]|uniref:Uncharacterized protein n=1 Tax=Pomacea canaliculata TaxID=400727 RepID=A0A2T7PRK7_POMCA|nr:hypothetical protein C0Q70_03029 [Pomacea canaliculata]
MNPQHTNTRASIYPKGYTALRASTGQRETSTTTANAMGGGNGSCMFGVTWRLHHCPRASWRKLKCSATLLRKHDWFLIHPNLMSDDYTIMMTITSHGDERQRQNYFLVTSITLMLKLR